ncbi:hypothetical protein R1sor_024688 [Riccia sorocarpa]|uniref:Uncharacterized protein n=1 Tax=Riccia sorocarpa TaxID=122646 RepID=A0ABD3GTG1_9MARC
MATKHTRLYFDDLAARLKTKFSISRVWFVTLNVTDASLVIWKHAEPDLVKCGNLLQCILNTKSVLEVLAMKDGGTFVRLTLEPKNMDRQTSKTALGGDLLSAKDSQYKVLQFMVSDQVTMAGTSSELDVAALIAQFQLLKVEIEKMKKENEELRTHVKLSDHNEGDGAAQPSDNPIPSKGKAKLVEEDNEGGSSGDAKDVSKKRRTKHAEPPVLATFDGKKSLSEFEIWVVDMDAYLKFFDGFSLERWLEMLVLGV